MNSARHWKTLPLKELVIAQKGKRPEKLTRYQTHDTVPYLDIQAIEKGIFNQYADVISTVVSTPNDLFVVADGSRSGFVATGRDGAVGSTILCLTPLAINRDYLYYFLKSQFEYLNKNVTGIGIPHLDTDRFFNLKVPIAPIKEQEHITSILKDQLQQYDANFSDTFNELTKLDDYKDSLLLHAFNGDLTTEWRAESNITLESAVEDFGKIANTLYASKVEKSNLQIPNTWLITTAEAVCNKITDGEHQTPKRLKSGELLLSAKNVRDGFIDYSNVDYISKEDFKKLRLRCRPEKNDVLIVSVGATIGRTALLDDDKKFALVRSVALLKPKIKGKYLMYCLRSPILQDQIRNKSKGVAQSVLYLNKIKSLPIPFPSIKEQEKIIEILDSSFLKNENERSARYKRLQEFNDIRQAVLRTAFEGNLIDSKEIEFDSTWFEEFNNNLEQQRSAMIESIKLKRKLQSQMKTKAESPKTIIELLKSSPKGSLPVEELWQQSIFFKKGDIEKFYEEVNKLINSSEDKIVFEFSDDEKIHCYLKLENYANTTGQN